MAIFEAINPGKGSLWEPKYQSFVVIDGARKGDLSTGIRSLCLFAYFVGGWTCICLVRANFIKAYEKLGAHVCINQGVSRCELCGVGAECQARVSVIGNFNNWDGRRHPMRSRGRSWHLGIIHSRY